MREFNWIPVGCLLLVCGFGASLFPEDAPSLYATCVLAAGGEGLRFCAVRRDWLFPNPTDYLSKTQEGRIALFSALAGLLMILNTAVTAELERWYYMGAALLCSGLLLVGVHHAFVTRRHHAFTLFTFFFGLSLVAIIACGGLFW